MDFQEITGVSEQKVKIISFHPVIKRAKTTLIEDMGYCVTDGERNRRIIEHMEIVPMIAAKYRGRKGIPFDDLMAQGRLGLVQAAHGWQQLAGFRTYATHKIHSAILDFIDHWQLFTPLQQIEAEIEREFYEWEIYPGVDIIHERWRRLDSTPEAILSDFQEIEQRRALINSAMLSLSPRERKMLHARFFQEPKQSFASIARDNKVSYARTIFVIKRAIGKIREVIDNIDSKRAA